MDIYTLCFTFPSLHLPDGTPVFHPLDDLLALHGSASRHGEGEEVVPFSVSQQHLEYIYPSSITSSHPNDNGNGGQPASEASQEEFEEVHQKCLAISSKTGCLVSAVILPPSSTSITSSTHPATYGQSGKGPHQQRKQDKQEKKEQDAHGWEFQLSGGYEQVMIARRMVMSEFKPLAWSRSRCLCLGGLEGSGDEIEAIGELVGFYRKHLSKTPPKGGRGWPKVDNLLHGQAPDKASQVMHFELLGGRVNDMRGGRTVRGRHKTPPEGVES
ncbi:hypothetical protein QFC21_006346 [Naganishia friedmannii]|uniref:Uncharacterized protein n=1 Tax=Naganishia friedmannii TaxID=89922 RepID=A0ACC2V344_9TREE|nr:hypothetical protein QFC21_006346 [Naganishia friedmannii]